MNSLIDICLIYIKNNINDIIKSPIISNINEELLTKIADTFSNTDINKINNEENDEENLNEIKNYIKSFIYSKLILSLTLPEPENWKGHYISLIDIYKCKYCKKLIPIKISNKIKCVNNEIIMNKKGDIIFIHDKDNEWNLTKYIENIKNNLKNNIDKFYWKLWSECHYIKCTICNLYYSLNDYDKCYHHSDKPIFHSYNKNENINKYFPVGLYKCCGIRTYIFECISNINGCKTKKHKPLLNNKNDAIIKIFKLNKNIILNNKNNDKDKNDNIIKNKQIKYKLISINKNNNKKGLIDNNLKLINKHFIEKYQREFLIINDKEYYNENNINVLNKYKMNKLSNINIIKKQCNPMSIVSLLNNDISNNQDINNEKLIKSMEPSITTTSLNYFKNKHNNDQDGDNNIKKTFYNEGCCLPMQDINSDDKYFNKPIQYTKKSIKHKKTKCGLQINKWYDKFSTRFNQDNQRDIEKEEFNMINYWLTKRTNCFNALTDENIIDNYILNNEDYNNKNKYEDNLDINEDTNSILSISSTDSISNNSLTSYCSTINSTIRVNYSRTSKVWNSYTPLAGIFVRIETQCRNIINNKNNNNSSNKERNNKNDNVKNNMLLNKFNSKIKTRKYAINENNNEQQTQKNLCNNTNNYKNIQTTFTMNRKLLEIPLTYFTDDYNKIWNYDNKTHELDYLSATYMPVINYNKNYKFINRELQDEWNELIELEKSWNAFLNIFNENEIPPKIKDLNVIQQKEQSYNSLHDLHMKIDKTNLEQNDSTKINKKFQISEDNELNKE